MDDLRIKPLLLDFISWLNSQQTDLVMYAGYDDPIYLEIASERLDKLINRYLEGLAE
jgi:hypothetical protein